LKWWIVLEKEKRDQQHTRGKKEMRGDKPKRGSKSLKKNKWGRWFSKGNSCKEGGEIPTQGDLGKEKSKFEKLAIQRRFMLKNILKGFTTSFKKWKKNPTPVGGGRGSLGGRGV